MKERLISYVSCWDGEYLWCYDEIICTLSKINVRTLAVEIVLSSKQICVNGDYKAIKLIEWKSKIIIVPIEIDKNWIIYDKEKNTIEYNTICFEHHKSAEAILTEDKLVLFPISTDNPIVIIDLLRKKEEQIIFLSNSDFTKKNEIWYAKKNKSSIWFLIQRSFLIGRLYNDSLDLIYVKSKNPLLCADFCDGFGWGIDIEGDNLYQFDEYGNILRKYFVGFDTLFAKIVIKNKYIFLLPVGEDTIKIFDIEKEEIREIKVDGNETTILFQENFGLPFYWDCVEIDSDLWILPLKNQMQIINLESLLCRSKIIEYPEKFSKNQYWEGYKNTRKYKEAIIVCENTSNTTIKRYIELIKCSNKTAEKDKKSYAEVIWKEIN